MMFYSTSQRLGRLLLALPFILGGWEAAREPGQRADQVKAAGMPRARMMVRLNGIVMVVAGIALAFSRLPRQAAAILSLVLVPTTVVGHAFWKEADARSREVQLSHFVKNLALIGGLLLVPDQESRPFRKESGSRRSTASAGVRGDRALK